MARPVPEPNPEYLKFLRPYSREILELALATRSLVLEQAPGARVLIYDGYNAVTSGYSFSGRPSDAFIHVAVYAGWVNLGFNRGAALPDPAGLLKGTGKTVRHIRIAAQDDLKRDGVRELVRLAIEGAVTGAAPGGSVVRAVYPKRRRPVK